MVIAPVPGPMRRGLVHLFGLQFPDGYLAVIQVVKGRKAAGSFEKAAELPIPVRCPCQDEGRGEELIGSGPRGMLILQGGGSLPGTVREDGGTGGEKRLPAGVHAGVQGLVLAVHGAPEEPTVGGLPGQAHGHIPALLQIVPHGGNGRVDFRDVQILEDVAGVSRLCHQGERPAEFLLAAHLHRQVPVALAVARKGIPVRLLVHGTGDAPLGIIPGNPGVIPPADRRDEKVRIGPELFQVAVLPDHHCVIALVSFRRVPEVFHMEGIASMGMRHSDRHARRNEVRPAGLPDGERRDCAEGTAADP